MGRCIRGPFSCSTDPLAKHERDESEYHRPRKAVSEDLRKILRFAHVGLRPETRWNARCGLHG